MIAIVCGDRFWTNEAYLFETLDRLHAEVRFSAIIEGEAPGADTMARWWAENRGVDLPRREGRVGPGFPAEWDKYGLLGRRRAAGSIRNQEMLDVLLSMGGSLVVAFHPNIEESKGTKDMVGRAIKAGVEVMVFAG